MSRKIILSLLVAFFLLTACGADPAPPVAESVSAQPVSEPEAVQESVAPGDDTAPEAEPVISDCLNGEVSPIGQSIADDFETTSYEQVIAWFCNGAEYEDILVALETESLTETSAEEMLQMLADDFSWEEIWLLVGLTN